MSRRGNTECGRLADATLTGRAIVDWQMASSRAYTRRVRTAEPMTADELFALDLPNKQVELVRGRLFVREPPGARHGEVAMRIAFEIMKHVEAHALGRVFAAETGFHLFSKPDTVRAPDVAFVRRDRIQGPVPVKYLAMSPDLAVEVLSPDDRPGRVLAKVGDWLEGGSAIVWVVDPVRCTARVHRADGSVSLLQSDAVLFGDGVLPGFELPLTSVL